MLPLSAARVQLITLMRRWMTQASELVLEKLLPRLSVDDIRDRPNLISGCAKIGMLSAAQHMLQITGRACVITATDGSPYLSLLTSPSTITHRTNRVALLRLIHHGLDPTLVCAKYPRSALQVARSYVKVHPPPPELGELDLLEESMERMKNSGGILLLLLPRNHLTDEIAQYAHPPSVEESQRCERLHARFMHALVSTWRDHSFAVRALLLEAAPHQLIPDLADMCAEYLDLDPTKRQQPN